MVKIRTPSSTRPSITQPTSQQVESTTSPPNTEHTDNVSEQYRQDGWEQNTPARLATNNTPSSTTTTTPTTTNNNTVFGLLLNGDTEVERTAKLEIIPDGAEDDLAYNGAFLGAGGVAYKPTKGVKFTDIPPVLPKGIESTTEAPTIFINGIKNNKDQTFDKMQTLADATQLPIIAIHNSTAGIFRDTLESIADKLDIGKNPPVDTLKEVIYTAIKEKQPLHLIGYSQGGLIVARALKQVQKRLRLEDGLSKEEAEKAMSHLKVETCGAAAGNFVDGPEYVHYVNKHDLVAGLFGLGRAQRSLLKFLGLGDVNPGKNACIKEFEKGDGDGFHEPHSLTNIYLKQRVAFADARSEFMKKMGKQSYQTSFA